MDAEILTATLRIVGYPLGLEKQDIDVIASIRDIESLDLVIPDAEEPADFIKRKSPSLQIDVLNLQAQLLPGHSGAPLLDSADRVVAIGSGGLRGGEVGRSWAIPWQAVTLPAVDSDEVSQRLTDLAEKDFAALSFSSTYPSQPTDEASLKTYIIRVVDANQIPIDHAEVLLTHSEGYIIGVTDSEGFYTFQLPTKVSYMQSQIQVEASGYPLYSRTLSNVLDKIGPEIVSLTALRLTSTPASSSFCEFAFLILDKTNEQPIPGATVSVTLGTSLLSEPTNSQGYFGSKLPCANPLAANLKVRVTATGYQAHAETVPLVGETKEILLSSASASTPTSITCNRYIPEHRLTSENPYSTRTGPYGWFLRFDPTVYTKVSVYGSLKNTGVRWSIVKPDGADTDKIFLEYRSWSGGLTAGLYLWWNNNRQSFEFTEPDCGNTKDYYWTLSYINPSYRLQNPAGLYLSVTKDGVGYMSRQPGVNRESDWAIVQRSPDHVVLQSLSEAK